MPFEGGPSFALPSGTERSLSMKTAQSAKIFAAVVAVSACASLGKPIPSGSELVVSVKAPESRTVDAVRSTFLDAGFLVDSAQQLPGVITAEPARIVWEGGRFSVCSESGSSIYPDFGGGGGGSGYASGVHVGFSHDIMTPVLSTFTVTVQGDS